MQPLQVSASVVPVLASILSDKSPHTGSASHSEGQGEESAQWCEGFRCHFFKKNPNAYSAHFLHCDAEE